MQFPRTLGLLVILAASGGCLENSLSVKTDPPGALVYVDGEELGRTPFRKEMPWYGTHDVTVRLEGYETLKTTQTMTTPWWRIPPMDLVLELTPRRFRDEHTWQFSLKPATQPTNAQLVRRAEAARQLTSGNGNPR